MLANIAGLGFPEFESRHLQDFSFKAQFPKSVASTIPPRPQIISLSHRPGLWEMAQAYI